MGKIDLGKPPYVFWVTVAILLFTGLVVFNAFTGELSKYTAEELGRMIFI